MEEEEEEGENHCERAGIFKRADNRGKKDGGRKSVREEEEEGEEVARGLQRRETLICISNRPP